MVDVVVPADACKVARGLHTVPEGIVVLEFLDGEYDKLSRGNPSVKALLEYRQLQYVFKYFATRMCKKGKTYIYSKGHRYWIESKLVEIVQEFQKDFSKKRVRLALCLMHSDCGHYRWFWLEFIDTAVIPDTYVPKYDISNHRLVLNKYHIVPTHGVEVHQLEDSDAKKFYHKTPEEVKAMLEPKGLLKDYEVFTKAVYESNTTRTWTDSWKTTEVLNILKTVTKPFEENGIELAVCKRPTGSGEACKWIEIVDTTLAPESYYPMYTVDPERRKKPSTPQTQQQQQQQQGHPQHDVLVMQDIVVDGQPISLSHCPAEVAEVLEQKGLIEEYNRLVPTIAACKSLRNFCDLWRLTEQGLVTFAPLAEYQASFSAKGIRLVLCESAGKLGRNYWLEYVDAQLSPNYSSPFSVSLNCDTNGAAGRKGVKKTKKVLDGRHRVPEGVEVDEITDAKSLTEPCPPSVHELLEPKGLLETYDSCMKAIAHSKATRSWGQWHSVEIANVLKDFEDEFVAQGVNVAMCKMKTASGDSIRWFEFIDRVAAEGYVPQYDVTNIGDEVESGNIKVEFPKGVAIEKLMDRKTVFEFMPDTAKALLDARNCLELYASLVELLCGSVLGPEEKIDEAKLKELTMTLGPKFEDQGVSIFLSYTTEAKGGPGKELFWMEFVDRKTIPNYIAQYGMDLLKLPVKAMSKEELCATIATTAAALTEEPIALMFDP